MVKPSVASVAGMSDRELVADGDRDRRERHRRQRSHSPPRDGAGFLVGFHHGEFPVLASFNLYRSRGLHEALGRAA
jgi:hypothetical protein